MLKKIFNKETGTLALWITTFFTYLYVVTRIGHWIGENIGDAINAIIDK